MLNTSEFDIKKDPILQLLAIQLMLFLAFQMLAFIGLLWKGPEGLLIKTEVVQWFALPYNASSLIWKPWTIVTSILAHEGFFHFLFNGLFLFFIGRMYLMMVDSISVFPLFFAAGLGGNVLSWTLMQSPGMQSFMGTGMLLGSSGALLGLMVALARIQPELPIRLFLFGQVKLKFVALAYLVLNILMLGSASNLGGTLAHLGGAAVGLWYGWKRSQGADPFRIFYRKRAESHLHVSFRKPISDEAFLSQKQKQQATLDELLEKVHRKGLSSLSKSERKLLDEYSKNS